MIISKRKEPVYTIELTEHEVRILERIINISPELEMPDSWKNFAKTFYQNIRVIMSEEDDE